MFTTINKFLVTIYHYFIVYLPCISFFFISRLDSWVLSKHMQVHLLRSFFYGHLLSYLPVGIPAQRSLYNIPVFVFKNVSGWAICLEQTDAGPSTWILLLRLFGITSARRYAGGAIQRQMGVHRHVRAEHCGNYFDPSGCPDALWGAYRREGDRWHWIGM